jgi:hypothetical protein
MTIRCNRESSPEQGIGGEKDGTLRPFPSIVTTAAP